MKISIEQLPVGAILGLRHQELRQGKPLESAHFPNDTEALHYGLFYGNKLCAVASIFFMNCPLILPIKQQAQLRGMATDAIYQGKGLGRKLLNYIEGDLKVRGIEGYWCNARVSAQAFYTKCQWQLVSEEVFDIIGIGPHVRMWKAF